jgi:hypothetical protein
MTRFAELLQNLSRYTKRFKVCETGTVAVSAGVAITALLGVTGLAVDYAQTVRAHSALQTALDSAVLAAVHEDTQEKAKSTLDKYIAAQSTNISTQNGISTTIIAFDGSSLEVKAAASFPTSFGALFGRKFTQIEAKAAAKRAGGYQEIHFAIDFSSSLGMAASDADRVALENLTQSYTLAAYGSLLPQGCAFGCHAREGWEPGTKTVYQMARDAGIKLREDELLTQFNGLVDLLLDPNDSAVQNGARKVGVIGFSGTARQLVAPTNSAATVKASASTFPNNERLETNFSTAFATFDSLLGTQGDGSSGNPLKTLVLITDGIDSRSAYFAQKAIDLSLCTSLKSKGFRLAIVEIKYPKLINNNLYDDTVLPVETTISPAMQQCASPGWYFQASNQANVPAKFNELKNKLTEVATRLAK